MASTGEKILASTTKNPDYSRSTLTDRHHFRDGVNPKSTADTRNLNSLFLQDKGLMLPPIARQKIQAWIRSRHLICSGNFFIFETLDYSAIERFEDCISSLGGTLISVEPLKKVWMGNHRQVILYHAKASLHTPHHDLKQYWFKYGAFHTRFDLNV